jgi:hypothetical protein
LPRDAAKAGKFTSAKTAKPTTSTTDRRDIIDFSR